MALGLSLWPLTVGNRVKAVTLGIEDGGKVVIPVAAFRQAAGGLKSAPFTLAFEGSTLRIDGKGHGHGVGLSQLGVKALARKGWSHEQILGF